MHWAPFEHRFLNTLNTPEKIQAYVDSLVYNPEYSCLSPRFVMLSGDGHCFEGALMAAAALDFHGHAPLVVNLQAHRDDSHIITVYKSPTGWGSIAKSNTTLLRGRAPVFRNIRELVLSYFDFYFNVRGQLSLYAHTDPVNLNRFNHRLWRTSEENVEELAIEIGQMTHYELLPLSKLSRLPKVSRALSEACFLGANPDGLFQPS